MAFGLIKKVGGGIVDRAKDVGGGALNKAKEVGGGALNKAKEVGGDVVSFSKEAWEFKTEQEKNFANGVLDWGKGSIDTVVSIATHPVETVKALDKLASNPVLNPIGGTARAVISGKNPITAYKDGLGDLKDLGGSLLDGYKETYKEHGVAGVAGSLAPDILLAVASGGGSAAAKTGGTAAGKTVAKEVAQEAAEQAVKPTVRSVVKGVAQDQLPGPSDIVAANNDAHNPDREKNFLEVFIENFQIR